MQLFPEHSDTDQGSSAGAKQLSAQAHEESKKEAGQKSTAGRHHPTGASALPKQASSSLLVKYMSSDSEKDDAKSVEGTEESKRDNMMGFCV